jgi:hypothetical protein
MTALLLSRIRLPVLIASMIITALVVYFSPVHWENWPGQWPAYHLFADRRGWLGVPNAGDVLSNLPFLFTGAWGFFVCWNSKPAPGTRLTEPWERRAWLVMFAGVFATGLGSGYYHWNPNNDTLFWDRLPMAVVFALTVCVLVAERVSWKWGRTMCVPFTLLAVGTVVFWTLGERAGRGDLRPYGVLQGASMVIVPVVLLLWRPRYSRGGDWWWMLAFYLLAKALEQGDRVVFDWLGGTVSGHSLKHLAAAAATAVLLVHIRHRRTLGGRA